MDTFRKVMLRLLVPLTVLEILNSLDRVNIGFAALRMNADLGLSMQAYGFGASLFFVGYLLFQIPSGLILRAVGAQKWLFWTILAWGVCATGMAFIQSAWQFYCLRTLLGFAEAGFAPGIVYYTSFWLPERYRAGGISFTLLAVPVSVILGAPLSGYLLSVSLPHIAAWRWMFLAEGLPTVLLALVSPALFPESPARASWLSEEERRNLLEGLPSQQAKPAVGSGTEWKKLIGDPRLCAAAGIWFFSLIGAYGIIFWLPIAIKQLSGRGELSVGLLTALPWIGVGAGMILNAWHSDRSGERRWHLALAAVVACLALSAAVTVTNRAFSLVFLIVAGIGLGGAQGVFWPVPLAFLRKSQAATGIMLINMLGNVGGLIAPLLFGWIRTSSGSFTLPVYVLSAGLFAIALLTPFATTERPHTSF